MSYIVKVFVWRVLTSPIDDHYFVDI